MTILNTTQNSNPLMPSPSGTFTFSVVRDDIIRQGMMNLALLEEQELPTAQETTDCARVLNMIIKQLAGTMDKAPGFKMFQRARGDLFLGYSKFAYQLGGQGSANFASGTAGVAFPQLYVQNQLTAAVAVNGTVLPVASTTGVNVNDQIGVVVGNDIFWTTVASFVPNVSITIPAPGLSGAASANAYVWNYTVKGQRPIEIVTAVLRDITGTDTPLTKMTLEEYEALPTKVQPGFVADPTAWYYEPRVDNLTGQFYIDCSGAQDVTKHIHVVFLRQAMDFDNPGDAPEFPQEWFLPLSWMLSLHICGTFDADWTPDRQAAYAVSVGQAREANPQQTHEYFLTDDPDGQ